MKLHTVVTCTLFLASIFGVACKGGASKNQDQEKSEVTDNAKDDPSAKTDDTQNNKTTTAPFDVNSLPKVDKDFGAFPYFKVPDWVDTTSSYGGDRNSEFSKLEVYTGQGFYPVEGRVFVKSYNMIKGNDRGTGVWDEYRFVESFKRHFEGLGAKKLFEGVIPQEAIDALNKAHNKDDYYFAFSHSQQENKVVYGLINKGKPIFFSIATNSAYGSIAVAEAEAFKQTITLLKADDIKKELDDKGKAVLHINFDTDKATLQPDGKTAVAEIAKVLQNDAALKLDINGYTDNTGNDSHNLQLSKDRANAVLNSLVSAGIAKNRLNANGFGSQNAIASNDNEDGKAQNRRVELIKK